jgi:hypothetical protein
MQRYLYCWLFIRCCGSDSAEPLPGSDKGINIDTHVRIEVFTAVTIENVVFWDIKPEFVPHRRHYVSTTESSQLMLCKI